MPNTHDESDPVEARPYQPQNKLDSLSEVESTNSAQLGEDLSLAVKGMYPLLDLITEQGSSGLVDKIVIAQQSLQEFINTLSPGAYSSITEVDFKLLDNVVLKPFGIYGSKEEIVRFLSEIKAVDDSTVQKFLLPRNGLAGGSSEPVLRSGLYIVRSFLSISEEQAYVVYWPEDTTWDDRAASHIQRNRITFMRYLSKLCDQLICLLSSEHSTAIMWSRDDDGADGGDGDDDSDGAFTDSEKADSNRFYQFEVAKAKDQEENVIVREGFVMSSPFVSQVPRPGVDAKSTAFCPALLHGEKVQGFMTTTFFPARTIVEPFAHDHQTADQIRLRLGKVGLYLSEEFDKASLKPLNAALGLKTQFPKECEAWERSHNEIERRFQQIISQRKEEILAKIEHDFEGIRVTLQRAVVGELLETFPSLRRERFFPESRSAEPTDHNDDSNNAENSLRDLFLLYPRMEQMFLGNIREADFGECLKGSEFQFKKKRMMFFRLLDSDLQNAKSLSADLTRSVADAVLSQQDENSTLAILDTFEKDDEGYLSRLRGLFRFSREEGLWENAKTHASSVSDSQFLSELQTIPVDDYLHDAAVDVEDTAYALFTERIEALVSRIDQEILAQKLECHEQSQREVDIEEARAVHILWSKFLQQVKDLSIQHTTPRTTVYLDHFEVRKSTFSQDTYHISGRQEYLRDDETEYRIYLLQLRADEKHKVQLDPSYVPTPVIEDRLTHSFHVSPSIFVKYAHLLEGGRILLGLVDPQGNIVIYIESLSRIDAAIQKRSFAMLFHKDKIGETCLLALDESKHMLAVYSSARVQLHIFTFDAERGTLRGMGSAIDLRPFYNNGESILHACFVHGREEILFLDSSAQARIFSLTMLQPKPASLKLPQVPRAIYSSPDGSCALVVQENDGVFTMTAYHWTTFASTDGIPITLPDFPVSLDEALLTSVVNRNKIHLIGLDVTTQTCRSVILDITCKATEFTFQEERSKASTSRGRVTTNNCLIDCHSDVWTRFPVVAAVKRHTITSSSQRQRRTLTFITDDDQYPFTFYFSEMVRSFTKTSRKPTGDVLKHITVSARTFPSFAGAFLSSPEWPVSRFRAGEWLVDLLCLIPIHIAITHENRFVPLKDGVLSAQLEISLLGAEVDKIVDSLSIGWYESIFQSYWGSKPVKVVSSMGEQSVGKSFTLNHLVDTSFAGSATRTTEGVWLSVSPTDDALIVALDFEGVHSLERSAQEDTLLVLFNTAISNLVLFRNNFAMNRDITGLFQSFQSSASILDPAANPSLFQSTLLVIIKDVIDSDEGEVTKEFSLKFQKIVEDNQDCNFITRLHAGKLSIIPWPVIGSKEFYKLFGRVKKALDQQPTSHRTAWEFLLTLKTLMAKLKANDWGAMSQTMAIHRANSLLAVLPSALETGFSEVAVEPVPLKNIDAGAVIEAKDSEARFILAGRDTPVADHERQLAAIRESWDRTEQRQHVDDSTWHSDLSQYLTHLVDLRVAHVENWLESNVQSFESDHAGIEELRRTFGNAVIDLRASVELCWSRCDSCNLVCVQSSRLHRDGHDCLTNHECIHKCTFCERDALPTQLCGQAYVHPHSCHVGNHLCGELCEHSEKRGCTEKCVKPTPHEGNHLCSAPVHMCGQPCSLASLRLPNGKVLTCSGACRVPIGEEHELHECEDKACYASCQLCKRMCAGGHLHGLIPGENHLCGNQHPCGSQCSGGICLIQTKPQTIKPTSTGKHVALQYTKYTQVAKRLPCAKLIEPGETEHPGPHLHSDDKKFKPFHHCDARCGDCGYFCTLPSGHPQKEHETSHGSMSQTRWIIDGSDDTGVELKGHKFSNDEGGLMLCHTVCMSMGRHVHVDICRGSDSHDSETQHIDQRISPNPDESKDWITHALHWRRMGFKDPYSRKDQADFAECDAMCPGTEHTKKNGGTNPQPSGCTLSLFHMPLSTAIAPRGPGYMSNDGHHFTCKKPGHPQAAFHVIFVIKASKSMGRADIQPLPNAAGTSRITLTVNNRFGAVISSLYSFWTARQAATIQNTQSGGHRRDAYSVVFFNNDALTCVENDLKSSPDELLTSCLRYKARENDDYTLAIEKAQAIMISHWSTERAPVLIFLTDGRTRIEVKPVNDICRAAVGRGMPLSFHAVSFGPDQRPQVMHKMVQIAQEVEKSAPHNSLTKGITSSFTRAVDSVKLTATFQGFANSLTKARPRSSS
ncbi:hypothetical protein EDB84DRAFT_1422808 [Lactarius hengduanensis]|nr:hypothetical protein EDB84DRAFT_1422808 [Lactarius hengduanensis]